MNWLIRNGRLIDPANGTDAELDVRLRDGGVAEIGANLTVGDEATFDARGRLVMPGLIDMHVHLRDPGQLHKETVETGTRAAAAGGFVAVACMANTTPTLDSRPLVQYVIEQAKRFGSADVHPIGAITVGLEGLKATPYDEMRRGGAVGFSDDGKSTMDAALMGELLYKSAQDDFPALTHCEDPAMSGDGAMHAGRVAEELGVPGVPPIAEESIIARDTRLALVTGGHAHIQHVTTRRGVDIIRQAKARGANVTAEACPHHFTLTHEAVREHGTNAKMNPPLRTEEDRQGVIEGLIDGTLDAIATDHAPHSEEEKARGMTAAPFGIIGLELCVPLTWTQLVEPSLLTASEAIRRMTTVPARILRLPTPTLEVGAPANITVIDPRLELEVTEAQIFSKSRNTPFLGTRLRGWPILTLRNGKEIFRRSDT